jgi:D-lyxose ketol-isomerase
MMPETKHVDKVWGYESHLRNKEFCVKRMGVDQGAQCSVHFHHVKKEMFIVTKGVIMIELWEELVCPPGLRDEEGLLVPEAHGVDLTKPDQILVLDEKYGTAAVYINHLVPHRFTGLGQLNVFIEASTHDDPADSYRFTKSRSPDNR